MCQHNLIAWGLRKASISNRKEYLSIPSIPAAVLDEETSYVQIEEGTTIILWANISYVHRFLHGFRA
jgi:hypothetical protein